jgi:hypothetical protein
MRKVWKKEKTCKRNNKKKKRGKKILEKIAGEKIHGKKI